MTRLEVARAMWWLRRQVDDQIVGDYARTILALLCTRRPALVEGSEEEG